MARNPVKQAYGQAKRIAHAIEHPDKFVERASLEWQGAYSWQSEP
jgi:hypothetical protein